MRLHTPEQMQAMLDNQAPMATPPTPVPQDNPPQAQAMTTAERDALTIGQASAGVQIWNTDEGKLQTSDGAGGWI